MSVLEQPDDLRRVLESSRTIAVLGAHDDRMKPANYVPDYLFTQGYRILPVNPMRTGTTLWGEPVRATLAELVDVAAVDIVDIFRRSADVAGHLDDILAMRPLPRCVWLQLGIRDAAVTRALSERGIDVVEDRCMLQDHRLLGIAKRPR